MILNHRLMIAIVKRAQSRSVIAAANSAGADGATVLYARGLGRNEKPTFLGLPTTHEKAVLLFAVDGELEQSVTESVKKAGSLGKSGYGLGFTVHLEKLLGVPNLSDRPKDTKRQKGEKEMGSEEFDLIVTIVNSGDSDKVVKAAADAGAEGGTIISGRGTALNEQQKFLNFTIDPEKDVVLTLIPAALTEAVISSIERKINFNEPGKGILFLIDVDKVFGVNHSSLSPK